MEWHQDLIYNAWCPCWTPPTRFSHTTPHRRREWNQWIVGDTTRTRENFVPTEMDRTCPPNLPCERNGTMTTVPSTVTSTPPTAHVEPMDLDIMASSRNLRHIHMHPRCYNCNGYVHIPRDCKKDSRRLVPGLPRARERLVRPEQLHLFEEGEIVEGTEEKGYVFFDKLVFSTT